jgi:putative membrane protein
MQQQEVRATDALANERTYLAYVRTAIAFIAFGFVVARFSLFVREIETVTHTSVKNAGVISTFFGSAMSVIGILVGILGGFRYACNDRALRQGRVLTLSPILAYVGSLVLAAAGVVVALSISATR